MTEFKNAQAIGLSEPTRSTPAPEDQAIDYPNTVRSALDLPLPSGGDAGPIARKAAQPSPPSRSATIPSSDGQTASRHANPKKATRSAISSAQAEPIASRLAQTHGTPRSATNSPAIGSTETATRSQETTRASIEATPIHGAPASTIPAKAGPIAMIAPKPGSRARSATNPAKAGQAAVGPTHTSGRPQPATTPARKRRAISGQPMRALHANPAADSEPSGSNAGDGGQWPCENQNTHAAVNLSSGDGGASGHAACIEPQRTTAARKPSARKSGADGGHGKREIQAVSASIGKPKRRHQLSENHMAAAAPGGDSDASGDATTNASTHAVTALLIPMVRRHAQWHSAWMRLVLQGRAIGRGAAGGDKKAGSKLYDDAVAGKLAPEHTDLAVTLTPLIIATERLATEVAAIDKAIEKAAKTHPLWPWAKEVYGIGPGSLGKLIAQAHSPAIEDRDGNPRTPAFEISDYRTVAGLWKRFGLAVINGERQRMKSGIEGIEHAYAPRRRALMWNVGGGLIGFMQKGPRPLVGEDVEARDDLSPYQKLFVARLRSEAERDPAMRLPDAIKDGIAKESYKTHASNRARRYVEKRFLRHLYAAAQAVAGRGQGMHEAQRGAAAPQSKFG